MFKIGKLFNFEVIVPIDKYQLSTKSYYRLANGLFYQYAQYLVLKKCVTLCFVDICTHTDKAY